MFTQSSKTDSSKNQAVSVKQDSVKTAEPGDLQGVLTDPGFLLSPKNILQMQRTIGNQAVIQLLKCKFQQQPVGLPAQQMEPEEKESVDKAELQMKTKSGAIERAELSDEEELQMRQDNTTQRAEISEGVKIQMKSESIFQPKEMEIRAKGMPKAPFSNSISTYAAGSRINRPNKFQPPVQKKNYQVPKQRENNTGMPDNLKAGLENLAGLDLSDTRVHRNSDKPAQVGALAFTQGNDIHVASGQERHLPHEGWHVVQQKQGRVQATTKAGGC